MARVQARPSRWRSGLLCSRGRMDRSYRTDGTKNRHSYQEAAEAQRRLMTDAAPFYDEFLILRYRATNEPPYPFEWVDYQDAVQEYGSILTRISRNYDQRC